MTSGGGGCRSRSIGFVFFVIGLLLTLVAWPALAQEHNHEAHELLGDHPPLDADPYSEAKSIAGANCCHGTDCAVFHGDPEKVEGGWKFGELWFVRDDQVIEPMTLAKSRRGVHSLCLAGGKKSWLFGTPDQTVRCGYIASSGT